MPSQDVDDGDEDCQGDTNEYQYAEKPFGQELATPQRRKTLILETAGTVHLVMAVMVMVF